MGDLQADLSTTLTISAGDMLTDPTLPKSLIGSCMDVLLKLSLGERDFMRVVVEIVQNVREDANATRASQEPEASEAETEEDELDMETATPEQIAEEQRRKLEKAAKKIQNRGFDPARKDVYLRCLALVHELLERVAGVRRLSAKRCWALMISYRPSKTILPCSALSTSSSCLLSEVKTATCVRMA